jgi:hypothetical protein
MGWRLGTDDPAGLFAMHGWDTQTKQPGEEGARYDACRFSAKAGSSWSFFVVAQRTMNPTLASASARFTS